MKRVRIQRGKSRIEKVRRVEEARTGLLAIERGAEGAKNVAEEGAERTKETVEKAMKDEIE